MTAKTTPKKKVNLNTDKDLDKQWQTILHNCDCHEFCDAVEQIMIAIKCSEDTASRYAHAAHMLGSVALFKGEKEKCHKVADILGSIGLDVTVEQM
jgi:hypothetical protein